MRLSAVPLPEAERFVATIWRILVENALVSPRIEVRAVNRSIDIGLHFSSAEDCALAEKRFYEIMRSIAIGCASPRSGFVD
jgi:hypothetical protein